MLIDTFINSIYLDDEKIIITFNYKDGTKTITFEDIKGSDLDCPGAPRSVDKKDARHKRRTKVRRLCYSENKIRHIIQKSLILKF